MSWRGKVFGWHQKIFSAVANAMQGVIEQWEVEVLHNLDDFQVISPSETDCNEGLSKDLQGCQVLGVPHCLTQDRGPANNYKFLEIELDTIAMTLLLLREKVIHL